MNMENIKYAVITKVPDIDIEDSNLYGEMLRPYIDSQGRSRFKQFNEFPLHRDNILNVNLEAFHLGEVLIVDDKDREISGRMRCPYKWEIEYEVFDTVEDALERSLQVK